MGMPVEIALNARSSCNCYEIKLIRIPVSFGLPPVESWKLLTSSYKLTDAVTM